MRFLLAAHGQRVSCRRIPQSCLLDDATAAFEQIDLPLDFVLERLLHIAERVEILHFGLRAEACLARGPHRHVGVAAETALFHVPVVDAQPHQDVSQPLEEFRRLGGRAHVRLADDLDQGDAAPVVIDVGPAVGIGKSFVERLAGVLFHVDARQSDMLYPAPDRNVETTAERERTFILRNLVTLRQVGIEIILAREDRERLDVASERERRFDRVVDRGTVEDRQRARHAETDRAHLRVGRRAERRAAPAENFRAGLQLRVDF